MNALGWLLVLPVGCAALVALAPGARAVLGLCVAGSLAETVAVVLAALRAQTSPLFLGGDQLFLDPLSAYHAVLVVLVFMLSSLYAHRYFSADAHFDARRARRFGLLWFLFLASMLLTLCSNNLGLMWVGMEATTVASALLVCLDGERPALRAAWTYLLMCSVAIALALLGIVLVCADARQALGDTPGVFLWTELRAAASRLHPGPVRLAFLFALVGYGTKAGLAPMHSWLPEAHGQAPTPVSAVLSGVLLNCALYCLSRFLPLVDATSPGWAGSVLVPFGVLSMVVAAAFIVHEHDIKRLLAFHSVEHMGIITLGLGFGASAAALFHTLNHSFCKMLTFFCAGGLAQRYGGRDMARMRGTLRVTPLTGAGFLVGLLALIGTPPFSVFMSELWIARVGVEGGHLYAVVGFFAAAAVVFVAAFRHAVEMTWAGDGTPPPGPASVGQVGAPLVLAPLALLLLLGIWLPSAFGGVLGRAAALIGGRP